MAMNQDEKQDLYLKALFIKRLIDKKIIPNSIIEIDYKNNQEKCVMSQFFGEEYLPFVEFHKRPL
jgi:hypothetical protein